MFLGKGEMIDFRAMPEEKMQEWMAKWAAWMEKTGPSFTDVGAPFGPSTSLVDDGSHAAAVPLTGYSIVEADNLQAATELAEDHPFLSEGKGNFAMEIYELMPVPDM
jgi:hypothetical protein